MPGGELIYFNTYRKAYHETMGTEPKLYAAILQSSIFPFKANITMVMFSYDGNSGKFSLDVSQIITHSGIAVLSY